MSVKAVLASRVFAKRPIAAFLQGRYAWETGGSSSPVDPYYVRFDGTANSRAILPAWSTSGDFDLTFHLTMDTTAIDRQLFASFNPFEASSIRIYYDVPDGWEVLIGVNGNTTLHRFILGGQGLIASDTPSELKFTRRGGTIACYINGVLAGQQTIAGVNGLRVAYSGWLGGVPTSTTNFVGYIGMVKFDDLVDPRQSSLRVANSEGNFVELHGHRQQTPFTLEGNVIIGLDSLTAGVANVVCWPYYVAESAKVGGKFGGMFLCADTIGRENQNIFTTNSGLGTGIKTVDSVSAAEDSRVWSPHSRGITTVPASLVGTEYFQITSYTTYYHARVFYLAGPSQGTFRIQQPGSPLVVNCYAASLGLAYVDVPVAGGFTILRFDQFTGDVAIYGALCRSENYGQPGAFQLCNFARASQKITGFDDSKWPEWCTALNAERVIINGGMNDKGDAYAGVNTAFDDLIGVFSASVGAENVLILRPNNDAGTTATTGTGGVNAINGVWEYAARNRGAKFLSTVVAVGDYSVYSANSWLIDGTHPNPAGSVDLAAAIYSGDLNSASVGRFVGSVATTNFANPPIPNPNDVPTASTLALGDLSVGVGVVKANADLIAGVTDLDGDTLTVTSFTAISGGTVTGTGPWTITPTGPGAGSATAVITDGNGGYVNRTVSWNGTVAAVPTISGVSGTVADGQTITISGSNLAFANEIMAINGDEYASGTLSSRLGLGISGTANEWVFNGDGTAYLDGQSSDVANVYINNDTTPRQSSFMQYELRLVNSEPFGSYPLAAQIKLGRISSGLDGEHSVDPKTGMIWAYSDSSSVWQMEVLHNGLNFYTGGPEPTIERMSEWNRFASALKINGPGSDYLLGEVSGAINGVVEYSNLSEQDEAALLPRTFNLPGFFYREGLAADLQMRNFLVLDGQMRVDVSNAPTWATSSKKRTLRLSSKSGSSATAILDLTDFLPTDGVHLHFRDADGNIFHTEQLRAEVVDDFDTLTDNYGIIKPTSNSSTRRMNIPEYGTAALAADYVDYEIGFVVEGLDSFTAGTPIPICLSKHSLAGSEFRGQLKISHTTGDIVIMPMVNNTPLTIKAASDVHTNLNVRHDWLLRVPKNTGELITLHNAQDDSLIGSVARSAGFDGWHPSQWLYANGSTTAGSFKGRVAYLRAKATTGGVTTTLFDFRFTEAQAGLTSVPSAHDAGVVATIGTGITWGSIPTA